MYVEERIYARAGDMISNGREHVPHTAVEIFTSPLGRRRSSLGAMQRLFTERLRCYFSWACPLKSARSTGNNTAIRYSPGPCFARQLDARDSSQTTSRLGVYTHRVNGLKTIKRS